MDLVKFIYNEITCFLKAGFDISVQKIKYLCNTKKII